MTREFDSWLAESCDRSSTDSSRPGWLTQDLMESCGERRQPILRLSYPG